MSKLRLKSSLLFCLLFSHCAQARADEGRRATLRAPQAERKAAFAEQKAFQAERKAAFAEQKAFQAEQKAVQVNQIANSAAKLDGSATTEGAGSSSVAVHAKSTAEAGHGTRAGLTPVRPGYRLSVWVRNPRCPACLRTIKTYLLAKHGVRYVQINSLESKGPEVELAIVVDSDRLRSEVVDLIRTRDLEILRLKPPEGSSTWSKSSSTWSKSSSTWSKSSSKQSSIRSTQTQSSSDQSVGSSTRTRGKEQLRPK